MPKVIALLLMLILAGCSTMQTTANSGAEDLSDVQVLNDYPQGEFKNLGLIPFQYKSPGLFEASLTDALPQLKAIVRERGGNALIVRKNVLVKHNQLSILAEALSIEK